MMVRRRVARTVGVISALVLVILAGVEAASAEIDLRFGFERYEGEFETDSNVRLTRVPIEIEFGGAMSRWTVTIPYVRNSRTGNVTLAAKGPVILGVGGPGRPSFQTSRADKTEGGLGDILLRHDTFFVKGGDGKRPALALVVDLKLDTADEEEGLGTGERDWGAGLSYTQPLSPHLQLLADASYRFMGSPEGLDFQDRVWGRVGLAIITPQESYRLMVEEAEPVLDEVPLFDAGGTAVGLWEVDDRQVARLDIVNRLSRGGSSRLGITYGLNDSSEDIGFFLTLSSGQL
jgi:hypothetical protein